MRIYLYFKVLILAVLVISSCRTGKKQMQKGDYDQAVVLAVKRLKQNPDSRKAKETLPKAYEHSKQKHLTAVDQNLKSTDPLRWDNIVDHYEKMNFLYDEINSCPVCKALVPSVVFIQKELQNAKLEATKYHYSEGIKEMDKKEMMAARIAYRHFVKAKTYTPQYDIIDDWLLKSKDAATLKVLMLDIPMHSRTFSLSNEFFSNKIMEYARSLRYDFVDFYSLHEVEEFKIKPHQEIDMRFDDFIVGQTYVKETIEKLNKDSVKIGEVKTSEGKKPVYGTVKAELHTFYKSVQSKGLLDVRIYESKSGATIQQQKFPGTYIWDTRWAFFNGDEKALTNEQFQMTRLREIPPPAPQDLFIQFTLPIYDQVTNFLERYYKQHAN
jgi:hypothetical protein